MSWWGRIFGKEPELKRPFASTRARTYSADSGYVYEYAFENFRHCRGRESAYEYVFRVCAARRPPAQVSVRLPGSVLAAWETNHRQLTASERYGIAKLTLKRAFDRWPGPEAVTPVVAASESDVEEIAAELDF
jgi:hypothetical protein